jgi:hypothetical protein
MAGQIKTNASTDGRYSSGDYAIGKHVFFRARPNVISEEKVIPGAIELPSFGDKDQAQSFCEAQQWADNALLELSGPNDLIAALP